MPNEHARAVAGIIDNASMEDAVRLGAKPPLGIPDTPEGRAKCHAHDIIRGSPRAIMAIHRGYKALS